MTLSAVCLCTPMILFVLRCSVVLLKIEYLFSDDLSETLTRNCLFVFSVNERFLVFYYKGLD